MPVLPARANAPRRANNAFQNASSFTGAALRQGSARVAAGSRRALATVVHAIKDGQVLDRKLRVAVIGGGPSGACAAETLAAAGIETYLIERKMDNCKVGLCGLDSTPACGQRRRRHRSSKQPARFRHPPAASSAASGIARGAAASANRALHVAPSGLARWSAS
jgi:hypothetical protein